MKSIIILPTYNEAGNLESLVREIQSARENLDILIVDDSSPDGTGDIADRLVAELTRVHVIHRPAKSGRGSATSTGFKYAIENSYDYVFEIDVDFSHQPKEIPGMLEAASEADLVIASRFVNGGFVEGWNWKRKLIHFMADLSVKVLLGTPNTDHTNGFRCYRVECLKRVNFDRWREFGYIGQTILENLFYRLGFKIKEVPSVFMNREVGESKMDKKEMVNGLKVMFKYRWNLIRRGVCYFLNR